MLEATWGSTGVVLAVTGRSAVERSEVFGRLAQAELTSSYRLANRLLRDPDDAEDAVHEALLRAWASFDGLRDRDRFPAWLARIVVNTCRTMLERRRRTLTEPLAHDPVCSDALAPNLDRDEVERALATLSPDQYIAIVLRYWNDLAVDQIARLTGVPSGTVKWRLHNACRRLRSELEQEAIVR